MCTKEEKLMRKGRGNDEGKELVCDAHDNSV